ncbi:hydrolase, NUDIX family [Desulfitobacterium hafniense DP7]|nr:hydrolase, NUDIX family [Desulfitobacterium hafniense DP7]
MNAMPLPIVDYKFCPQCGKPLLSVDFSGQHRPHCPDCSFVFWGNFSLGVGGVVWHEGKVLLVQRAHNPGKGNWTIPGGYVEQDEQIAVAITREIREETGIHAKPLSVIALRDRPGEKHDAYIVFLLEYLGGTLQGEPEEVSDLGFFTLEECENLPIAQLSLSVIKASRTLLIPTSPGFLPQTGVKMIGGDQAILYQISKEPE